MKQSRILFLLPHPGFFIQFQGVGGHVAHLRGIIEGLLKRGFAVTLLCADGCPTDLSRNIEVVAITPFRGFWLFNRILWFLACFYKALCLKRNRKYSFLYIRYVISFLLFHPFLRYAFRGIPIVLEVNCLGVQHNRILKFLDRVGLRYADSVSVVSETLKGIISQFMSSSFSDRVVVINNGVDIERFVKPTSVVRRPANFMHRVGYVGVLKPNYGLDLMIDAFKRVSTVHKGTELVVVGEGPCKQVLIEKSSAFENIKFIGRLDWDDVPGFLRSCDILVYTATEVTQYGSPTKVYEYLASGTAIVAAHTPQTGQLLSDHLNGLLYPIGDVDAMARCISELISDQMLRKKIGCKAHESAYFHTWDSRVSMLLEALKRRKLLEVES